MRASLGPPPPDSWDNLNELRKIVGDLLSRGRAATAADYLERASAPESRPWDETDRIATLRLHLGEPAAARANWQKAPAPPKPAVRQARVAATLLVEGSFDRAREEYHGAIKADPELFEAHYGLAVLEQDAGRADDALKAARRAVATAPTDFARSAAQLVVATVTPYASSAIAEEKPPR
jgi:tetratricopeptide (TPR) repeat protein